MDPWFFLRCDVYFTIMLAPLSAGASVAGQLKDKVLEEV